MATRAWQWSPPAVAGHSTLDNPGAILSSLAFAPYRKQGTKLTPLTFWLPHLHTTFHLPVTTSKKSMIRSTNFRISVRSGMHLVWGRHPRHPIKFELFTYNRLKIIYHRLILVPFGSKCYWLESPGPPLPARQVRLRRSCHLNTSVPWRSDVK